MMVFRPPERRGERRQHHVREGTMVIGTAGEKRALSPYLSLSYSKRLLCGEI